MAEAVERIVIESDYAPREAFDPFHDRTQRWACIVAHRRAGKTVAAINELIKGAFECEREDPRFAYIAPYFAQAKDVAWAYLKRYTAPIPGVQVNESELRIDLPGGARIRLYGADNYDRLRGIYLDGVVLDEFADMDPRAWSEVIRPALSDRQGWAAFIGTPKGLNAFWEIYERSKTDPAWFSLRLRASETDIIPPAELEALKAELSANEYNRELEASFEASVDGAYYATQLEQAQREGRITRLARDPLMTIRAVWDIGGTGNKSDACAIWITQFVGKEIWVLDYYEAQGQPLTAHVAWLRANGYDACLCILPHDGSTNDRVFDVSYESALKAAGFQVQVVPNQGQGAAMARVEVSRRQFTKVWFDEEKTKGGRAALGWYHEKRDQVRGIGLGPNHDWSSHAADAYGLVNVAYEAPKIKRDDKLDQRSIYTVSSEEAGTSWMSA